MPPGPADVDAHLARIRDPQRATLLALRATLRKVLPDAEETIKYRMPCFVVQGKGVAAYDAFTHHCSYFPMSGGVLSRVEGIPEGWVTTAGTLQFPVDQPLPVGLVRKLVRARLDEISEVTDGKRFMFFDDGAVKAVGSMKDGERHGTWRWFRRDGTLLRTGRFQRGEQIGTGETYDGSGALIRASRQGGT